MSGELTDALRRGDLSYSRREAFSVDVVEDETCFTPDVVHLVEHDERDVLEQCLIENYDYCTDSGVSWMWTPLAFGPVLQSRSLPARLDAAARSLKEP